MRAVAQGLDERASWERYLGAPDERVDTRNVRRDIAMIRDAFAAAAKREGRPGTARLVLMDPSAVSDSPPLPGLADFARARGMEDFSEQEQAEAFAEEFGSDARAGGTGLSRRARVVTRQLEALRWLEHRVVQDPAPADPIEFWFAPTLVDKLALLQVATIRDLHRRIDERGFHWFREIPGVGVAKAGRVVDWLRANEHSLGLRLGEHVARPPRQLEEVDRAAVREPVTGLVPLDKLVVPPELGGMNVVAHIERWLAGHADAATRLVYRKRAERLLLWATLVHRQPVSRLTDSDLEAWLAFLATPPTAWLGPRQTARWSKTWRPLASAVSKDECARSHRTARALVASFVERPPASA